MAEEWDLQARPLVVEPKARQRTVSFEDVHNVRTALKAGVGLVAASAAVGHLSTDVDRALWTWIGVRIRRGADGTLTVE